MKKSWVFAAVIAAALAGCGGGGDDGPPAATASVPSSASESPTGFVDYLKELVASSADSLEPVDVSAVTPPYDDMAPPTSVD